MARFINNRHFQADCPCPTVLHPFHKTGKTLYRPVYQFINPPRSVNLAYWRCFVAQRNLSVAWLAAHRWIRSFPKEDSLENFEFLEWFVKPSRDEVSKPGPRNYKTSRWYDETWWAVFPFECDFTILRSRYVDLADRAS